MKVIYSILGLLMVVSMGCRKIVPVDEPELKYEQVVIKEENITPTVDIREYTLVSEDVNKHKKEAVEVLKVKRLLPIAIQRKDSVLFNKILASNFVFKGGDEFYGRKDYINDRITCTDTVITATYENMVLQFFNDFALLSYRNVVVNKGILNDSIQVNGNWTEYMSWADIFVKENDVWKISAIHQMEYRRVDPLVIVPPIVFNDTSLIDTTRVESPVTDERK